MELLSLVSISALVLLPVAVALNLEPTKEAFSPAVVSWNIKKVF